MTDQDKINARLTKVFESWRGTPYMEGQAFKQRAAGCYGFVYRVGEELYRLPQEPIPFIPRDLSTHDPRSAVDALKKFMERFPHQLIIGQATDLCPGDVLFFRKGKGPGHVGIYGPTKQLWHTTSGASVQPTGLAAILLPVDRLYRPLEQHRWI